MDSAAWWHKYTFFVSDYILAATQEPGGNQEQSFLSLFDNNAKSRNRQKSSRDANTNWDIFGWWLIHMYCPTSPIIGFAAFQD